MIAPAFLLFGVTSYVMNKKQQKVVGKVYGKDIYSIDFHDFYVLGFRFLLFKTGKVV